MGDKAALAEEKNNAYRDYLQRVDRGDLLPGVEQLIHDLRGRDVPLAVGSSSKNALTIVDRLGIRSWFDAIVDGNRIKRSKPDPEVF